MAQLKKWEANAQKPGIPDGVQVTDYTGQNHKTPWIRGFAVMLGTDWSEARYG